MRRVSLSWHGRLGAPVDVGLRGRLADPRAAGKRGRGRTGDPALPSPGQAPGDAAVSQELAEYERCAVLFDGNDEAAVQAARARWKRLKDAGHALTYWQQTAQGGWEKQG